MDSGTSQPVSAAPERWAGKFFTIWTGQALSLVGSALVQFALVWWLTARTGSATVLAIATLVALLPQILLGPFAGALVDRWNRRLIIIVADSSIAALTGVLVLLFALNRVQVWHIYVILLLRSLGGAFHQPAMSASTSLMVPRQHLARVGGINQALQGLLGLFAPPVAALLIGILPTQGILAIDIGTALLAVIPLLFIKIPLPPRQAAQAKNEAKQTSYWQDMREGLRYLVKWPGLLGIVSLAMLLNFLLTPASSLLPILIKNGFDGGPTQLAWTETVVGVGAILAGLILGVWGGFKRKILTVLVGCTGMGICMAIVGFTPPSLFWVLLVAVFLFGLLQSFANGTISAIMQSAVAPDVQGRVFSLVGAGATAMVPLSLLISGPLTDWLGIRTWYLYGGIIYFVIALAAFFVPAIMRIEENKESQPVETPA